MRWRLVVLLSGRGSNFLALDRACRDWLAADVVAVLSDRPTAEGLGLARARGTDTVCVDRARHAARPDFEASLDAAVTGFEPDLIVLAGFMRVLGADFVQRHHGRMINIHPSLLPRHRGLDTHRRALAAGDHEHGASVHFVTSELDGGPVISQVRMPIGDTDSPEQLAARLLPEEHRLLPATVALIHQLGVEVQHEQILVNHRPLERPWRLDHDFDDRGQRR